MIVIQNNYMTESNQDCPNCGSRLRYSSEDILYNGKIKCPCCEEEFYPPSNKLDCLGLVEKEICIEHFKQVQKDIDEYPRPRDEKSDYNYIIDKTTNKIYLILRDSLDGDTFIVAENPIIISEDEYDRL